MAIARLSQIGELTAKSLSRYHATAQVPDRELSTTNCLLTPVFRCHCEERTPDSRRHGERLHRNSLKLKNIKPRHLSPTSTHQHCIESTFCRDSEAFDALVGIDLVSLLALARSFHGSSITLDLASYELQ